MADPNPFEVTKAVDFSDDEIAQMFVDLPGGGFMSFANPAGPMPKFLVSGKGGGRTHLMRYYSFEVQKIRHRSRLMDGIIDDGYVGIYSRFSGLNSDRFSGKGQTPETWAAVFAFYMDLWFAHLTVDVVRDIHDLDDRWPAISLQRFAARIARLLDRTLSFDGDISPLDQLRDVLSDSLRTMDRAINNVALNSRLDVEVLTRPGELLFETASATVASLPGLENVRVVYLLDEYENITADQQRYINTLVREKELPSNFVIGSRRWGIRTHETLSASEVNRQGSEFDLVELEDAYRAHLRNYRQFCRQLTRARIHESGYAAPTDPELNMLFPDRDDKDFFRSRESRQLVEGEHPLYRSHFRRLRKQLTSAGYDSVSEEVLQRLSLTGEPLVERFAVMLFYREWSMRPYDLVLASQRASGQARTVLDGPAPHGPYNVFKTWRDDLLACMYDEHDLAPPYLGLNKFIEISGHLPRNLFMILKQVTRWSIFLGEHPFEAGRGVSYEAQVNGVREASNWFLKDSMALGPLGEDCQVAIRRLGALLRRLRYSDKPTEVSCITFSTDRLNISPRALSTLDACVLHSLLVETRGIRHRNSRVLHHRYQLNPMLAPSFDLPTARRGTLPLTPEELTAIFDASFDERTFEQVANARIAPMSAPFGSAATVQGSLL